jgi:biopolymer transport protein ExbB/TolQ
MPQSRANSRQELDVNLGLVLMIALMITISTYLIALPAQDSYIGTLLYRRGFTQYLVVFLASFVVGTILNKYNKIQSESRILRRMLDLPSRLSFNDHKSVDLMGLQQDLAKKYSMVTARVSRILGTYINSGSRKAASEFALDDSSFYLTASESSYTLPRILVWSIPLLGFIGTVLGISSAVNGFAGFLNNTTEIDKIKEGIGTVTSGLAVAFDTTLLALLLSVLVMIPLVLVERLEAKLLLATDVFINDQLLPQFAELGRLENSQPILDTQTVTKTITETLEAKLPKKEELIQPIKDALPSPEELVKPAEIYATEVAHKLTDQVINYFQQIQAQERELIESLKNINQAITADRNQFIAVYEEHQNVNKSIIEEIKEIVTLVSQNNQIYSQGLLEQTKAISTELNIAANSLNEKVMMLEQVGIKIAELNNLTNVFDDLIHAFNNLNSFSESLSSIEENITDLKPALQDLSKPRVIKLVEQIEPEST